MCTTYRKAYIAILAALCSTLAHAQQQYNPVTQIQWVLATAPGSPTIPCSATANRGGPNYGQPYVDTTSNIAWSCGSSGWFKVGGASPLIFRGTWNPGTSYNLGDVVAYSGNTYLSLQVPNANQNPVTQTAYWMVWGSTGSGITQLTGDVLAGPGTGSLLATAKGLNNVPFCNGYSPIAGQAIIYTTGNTPSPCYAPSTVGAAITLIGDVTGTGTGTIATSVGKINGVPLCTGFTPTNGQVLQYTTGGAPNPCYTAAAQSSGGYFPGSPTVTPSGTPGTNNNLLLATSPSAASWTTREALNLRTTMVPISGIELFGDSTTECWGASLPLYCIAAQLQNDIPGTVLANNAVHGYATSNIAQKSWSSWNPADGFLNPFVYYQGGINDANTLGAGTGVQNNAIGATVAGVAHIAIPFSNQTLASAATSSTGSWSAAGNFGLGLAPSVTGTFMSSTTNGSSRTYSLGSLAHGIYGWGASDTSAGTAHISVNGVLQTNFCTGTTTFNSFGCNGQIFNFGGLSILGQAFTNDNTGCDCLVVTVTSATSGSNVFYDGAVMMVPTGLAAGVFTGSNNLVGIQGVPKQGSDASPAATLAINNAINSAYTSLIGAGVTNIYFADVRNGVSSGVGYPAARALNTTTDYGGAGCPGGDGGLHLSNCGYFAEARVNESAAAAAGFPIFQQNSGSRAGIQPGGQTYWPAMDPTPPSNYSNDFATNPAASISTTTPMPGWCMYGPNTGTGCGARAGFEFSPSFNVAGNNFGTMMGSEFGGAGIGCHFHVNPASNSCESIWSPNLGAFHFTPHHFGAGTPNGNILQPATSTFDAFSIDSQDARSTITHTHQATVMYMQAGITAVEFPPCKSFGGVGGENWLRWFVNDSGGTISTLTFTPYSLTTDTVNGASSLVYNNVPAYATFQVQCSQGIATSSSINVNEILPNASVGISNAITSATGGAGTGTVTCVTATCTNLRGSYTVAGGTFTTGTLLALVWPTTTTAYVCSATVLNDATGASIGYHSVATATAMNITSSTSALGLTVDIDYRCSP